ncbi:CRP/FNR family transcriptional regulator [Mesonia hippocampi]|uniref:CRP/FNR family transcriptional regulator n=1 Tax=Mesonia hippocampi TaxID=1628250 RepID=A0A840ENF9_9FLAO|nr:Crp/Fnr family transcriptional regulator [Mesonia hippocampi]MBB4118635.1 CRP/FNR family transcriptional regulator [Mesonia hippocampi]
METAFLESYQHIFEKELLQEMLEIGTLKEVKKDEQIIDVGSYVKFIPLLINGAIKVLREDNQGDELFLYFLEKGETCSVTMSCCLGHHKSKIRAIAETDTLLITFPVQKMEEWTSKYKTWRDFVFQSYHERVNELLETIDTIAFQQMDDRLISYLKEKVRVSNSASLTTTHQEIAYDLHTSRVVISRLLKKLEKLHKIKLNRNAIEVLNLD